MFARLEHAVVKKVNSRFNFSSSISNYKNSFLFNFNKDLSFEDKINSALAQDDPQDAFTAFLQGIGFERLGKEYKNHAISAFKKAIELSTEDIYSFCSNEHIERIKHLYNEDKLEREEKYRKLRE